MQIIAREFENIFLNRSDILHEIYTFKKRTKVPNAIFCEWENIEKKVYGIF
jgi:hypothetical protein